MEKKQLVDLPQDNNGGEEPPQKNWYGHPMCHYQGTWCPLFVFESLLSFRKNFQPYDNDIVLASLPKAGTTWLKALLFSIVNRDRFPVDQSPLLTTNPHRLVFSLECVYYRYQDNPDLENMNRPRLFSTHLPHQVLPSSLINSESKIVYVCRNLLDQFISDRKFFLKTPREPDFEPLSIEESFDMFCKGIHSFGPFWEHILGYGRASLENPNRVLFLKYEDLKRDPISSIVKIGEFVGMPFSEEEKERGLVKEISELCSFEKMKELEINKSGVHRGSIENSTFFRKGEIGDWKNHLSPEMAQRLKQVVDEKMTGFDWMI